MPLLLAVSLLLGGCGNAVDTVAGTENGGVKDAVYYGKNVPLFRRNGYRMSGTMIP